MDRRKDGGPAFPVAFTNETGRNITWDGDVIPHGMHVHYLGMSLRDYFAGKALQAILSSGRVHIDALITTKRTELMDGCYALADAMLKASER